MAQEKRSDRIIASAAKERLKAELERRSAKTILEPDVISGDKELRALFTTVDGKARLITNEDLRRFRQNITNLKTKFTKAGFKGGINPKTIIDLSLAIDRQRAHREIVTATPLRRDGKGLVIFRTNASVKSNETKHIVAVRFLNFPAVVSTGKLTDALIREVVNGQVKFDCDCGRHRYWYRFLATAGGFAEGTLENGFPKIRNPNLKGVGCKHVLRVMTVISQSPTFKVYTRQWLDQYRQDPTQKHQHVKANERQEFEKKLRQESWKQRRVASREEKGQKVVRGKGIKPSDLSKRKREQLSKTMTDKAIKDKALIELEAAFKAGALSKEAFEHFRKPYA